MDYSKINYKKRQEGKQKLNNTQATTLKVNQTLFPDYTQKLY